MWSNFHKKQNMPDEKHTFTLVNLFFEKRIEGIERMYHYLGSHKHPLLRILLFPTQPPAGPPSAPVSHIHHSSKLPSPPRGKAAAGRLLLLLLPLPAPRPPHRPLVAVVRPWPPGPGHPLLLLKAIKDPHELAVQLEEEPRSEWGGCRAAICHTCTSSPSCAARRASPSGAAATCPGIAPHTVPARTAAPGSARAFQDNSELAQRVCFYEVGGLACAAPPSATMSVPHKLTGSAEVTNLSWTSVSTSVWWERHHSFLPCPLLCYPDQVLALSGPAERVPEEGEDRDERWPGNQVELGSGPALLCESLQVA